MKILFMGTPDFALFSLKKLVESGEEVVAVITQSDKPTGRGYILTPPPVKRWAVENGLPVYQPKTLKDEAFQTLLAQMDPDLIVVVAFGKLLPPSVIQYPKYGCINVHGSLLPEYRGAAPIQRAILDGKALTGITTMYMAEGLDTGDMLLKAEVPILPDDNFETMHDKLGIVGADLLMDTIRQLKAGTLVPQKQDDACSTYAPKIAKSDCLIDFRQEAAVVHNQIRGLSPCPLAFTHTPDGKILKVLAARISDKSVSANALPGQVIGTEENGFTVACGHGGALVLLTVLPEGKSRMTGSDFLRGRKLSMGDILQ